MPRNRRIGSGNQPAQQRLVADDLYVMLDTRAVGNSLEEAGNVRHISNGLQIFVPIEFLDQRNHIDRPRGFRKIDHARVNAPVGIEREVFDPQMLGCLVVGKVVEQDRAQNGALGFYICGKTADRVFGSCHNISLAG